MNAKKIVGLLYQRGAKLSVKENNLLIDAPDGALDSELLLQIKECKADIIALLEKLNASAETVMLTQHAYPPSYDCAPSSAQQSMLFMEELAGNSSYYNIPVAYKISGVLNKTALRQSLSRLVARHDVLRATYVLENNTYIQRIAEPGPLQVHAISLAGEADKYTMLERLLEQDAHYIFNLSREWPIRVSLIELDESEHILSINIHHIAADGWSARNIVSEISAGYQLYQNQVNQVLDNDIDRDFQYAEYIQWQDTWRNTQQYHDAKNYWVTALQGAPERHSLPTDFMRPTVQSVAGDTYIQHIPVAVRNKITACASAYKTTDFVIFQAVFAAFLARYSGESDIVFGTAAANRQPLEFINTVGLFVNTLALRYQISEEITFDKLIKQAGEVSARALRFQQFPFDVVVNELQPVRDLGYTPLVQVMLVMQENSASRLTLDGANVTQLTQQQNVSKFDLALHIYPNKDDIAIHWEFSTCLFKLNTIQTMASHLECLLDACLSVPDRKINGIPLVAADTAAAPIDPNNFPAPDCVHTLFERQAALFPENFAVRDNDRALTYRDLNTRADHIANHLYAVCGGQVGRIGLCMEKSAEFLMCVLAITKAGGTYVPLDPSYPKDRLGWMIQDSQIGVMLTSQETKLPGGLDTAAIQILEVGTLLCSEIAMRNIPAVNPDAPAYIIYTSGSTGKPKGVLVSHRSLFYSLQANQSLMWMSSQDVMPTIGSQAFGISLLEIFLPIISGGTVQIIKKEHVTDIEEFIKRTDGVTLMHAVPSFMRQWLDTVLLANDPGQYPHLRLLLVGGESVPDSLLQKIKLWRPEIRLVELYGMTESTVVCCSYEPTNTSRAHYCIGKPHSSARFYVMNSHGQQQPVGVSGELYIGGLTLATEYINQPEMTSEKFIESPTLHGERFYKTGDRVRLLDDGNFEFLGRVDYHARSLGRVEHQVKIRGFRIELGEIESTLSTHPDVDEVVVLAIELNTGDKRLVAYVVTGAVDLEEGTDAGTTARYGLIEALRQHLSQTLPDFMVPSAFVLLEHLPLTPNGKVDRKALPEPDMAAQQASYVAPRTATEIAMAAIWGGVLGLDRVGITDNFFRLGGDSLLSMTLISKLKAAGFSVQPKNLFSAPTVEQLAKLVDANPTATVVEEDVSAVGQVSLSPWQRSLIKRKGETVHRYVMHGHQPMDQSINPESLSLAFKCVVQKHDALRMRFSFDEPLDFANIIEANDHDVDIDCKDLSAFDPVSHKQIIYEFLGSKDYAINVVDGPLIRVALFKLGAAMPDQLVISVNHLICDMYSLDIILDDLMTAYSQINSGNEPVLPAVSASTGYALKQINAFARSTKLEDELDYWALIPLEKIAILKSDYPDVDKAKVTHGQKWIRREISATDTDQLLQYLSAYGQATVVDLLTYLVVEAQAQWLGGELFRINVQNNGRGVLEDEFYVDLSRVVGYYNLTQLLFLKRPEQGSALDNLDAMIEQIKGIPSKGCGIRYLLGEAKDEQVKIKLKSLQNYLLNPKIVNIQYLGVVGGSKAAQFMAQSSVAADNINRISLDALIHNRNLILNWTYNENVYSAETINGIVNTADKLLLKLLQELKKQKTNTAHAELAEMLN